MKTDFLVIGSGIAGLTYALKVANACPEKKVTVISKTSVDETNTKYAQGGVAGVMKLGEDSYSKHIEDTIVAGDGLCKSSVVEIVVNEGVDRINEMIAWGARFDKDALGEFKLGKEGGHSEHRILHHKDITGKEIERALLEEIKQCKNIELITHCYVLDLITQHHRGFLVTKSTHDIECYGVYVLNLTNNRIEKVIAGITMLATGGIGQVYRTTTNPSIATGDGVAMVYRAKGRIENMEFIQFHPTALFENGIKGYSFLITEAVRGEGAVLRNQSGEAFMEKYDSRKDLAPRDIVARAIDSEMKKNGTEFVYLDCTSIAESNFKEHFPNILEKCRSIGIDPAKDFIPVSPAAHYSCGGVKTDEWGRTSIKYLFASGECASTGLHGANRLASNSLLEAMVFAHRSFVESVKQIDSVISVENIPDWNAEGTTAPGEMILITQSLKELKLIMSDYVGIFRNNRRLQRANKRLDLLHEETEILYDKTEVSPQLCELRNMITVAYLIVKSAEFRKESRGLHYNTDYPQQSAILQNTIL
jgi:L-aspartate oxidase